MENNNTQKKAHLHYKGWKIPVVVLGEDNLKYTTKLDPSGFSEKLSQTIRTTMRDAYVDACCDCVGWGKKVADFDAVNNTLSLVKEFGKYALVFAEPEPEEAQDVPVDSTDIDDVPPQIDMHGELNQHLTLLARSGYKAKSFDLSIQEGGEVHLCAAFSREVDK